LHCPDTGRGTSRTVIASRIASLIDDLLATLAGGSAKRLAAVGIGLAGIFDRNGGSRVREGTSLS